MRRISIILNKSLPRVYLGLLIFFTFKWIFNYRKCTIGYLEVKFRDVSKEQSIIYKYLNKCIDIRKSNLVIILYFIAIIVIYEYSTRENIVEGII